MDFTVSHSGGGNPANQCLVTLFTQVASIATDLRLDDEVAFFADAVRYAISSTSFVIDTDQMSELVDPVLTREVEMYLRLRQELQHVQQSFIRQFSQLQETQRQTRMLMVQCQELLQDVLQFQQQPFSDDIIGQSMGRVGDIREGVPVGRRAMPRRFEVNPLWTAAASAANANHEQIHTTIAHMQHRMLGAHSSRRSAQSTENAAAVAGAVSAEAIARTPPEAMADAIARMVATLPVAAPAA